MARVNSPGFFLMARPRQRGTDAVARHDVADVAAQHRIAAEHQARAGTAASAVRKVAREPVGRQPRHGIRRARFLEQVGGARHDLQSLSRRPVRRTPAGSARFLRAQPRRGRAQARRQQGDVEAVVVVRVFLRREQVEQQGGYARVAQDARHMVVARAQPLLPLPCANRTMPAAPCGMASMPSIAAGPISMRTRADVVIADSPSDC